MMATRGKLLRAMLLTALWLSAVEGVMAAGRPPIPLPTQETPEELGLLPDLSGNSTGSSLDMEPSPSQVTLAQADLRLSQANHLLDLRGEEFNRSQLQEAIAFWEWILEVHRAVGNRAGEVHALGNLGNVYSRLGQYERAINVYQQQLAIAREIGDRTGESNALEGLGVAHHNLDRYDREQYRQAIPLFEDLVGHSETATPLEVHGQLEDGDKVLPNGSFYDLHTFEGEVGQFLEIRLDSNDFDAHLILVGPDGRQIAEDDDSGQGLNALISIQLPQTGDYSVIAKALDASGRGRYRLTVAPISAQEYQRGQQRARTRAEADQFLEQGIEQFNHSQFREALASWEQALELYRAVDDQPGEGRVLGNLGNAYNSLGQYERAIDFYEQILVIFRDIRDDAGQGRVLGNLGNAYDSLGQYERAIDFHVQALVFLRDSRLQAEEGSTLGNLGNAYRKLGEYEHAINFHLQALAIARELGDRLGEGRALGNLGVVYYNLGQDERALEQYSQAVALFNERGARAEEALFLSNIGHVLNRQNEPELAIIFLKASVEVREAIRGNLRGLDTDLEQSFTDTVADSYRLLADLLLQQNRILEAQRVLDLLKIQELDDYLQEVQRNSRTASGIDYLRPEQSILDQYNQLQTSAITLGQERAQLSQRQGSGDLTPAERQRLQDLVRLEQDLAQQFNSFAQAPEIQTLVAALSPRVLRQTLDLEGLSALRNNLDNLDAALIYPLILEDRLELVITTADTEPLRRTVAVGRTELNAAIIAFRQALEDPHSDAQTPAQQLYRWLVEPLEADLAAAGVTTLLYAPDAALRYIPLAALHDGDQWLTERFRVNNITALSLEELTTPPQADPRVLAGAFADVETVHSVGSFTLPGLPYAGEEVILLEAALPDTVTLIDQAFDLDTVLLELGSANILHFATHGVFVPGDPSDSFILFGNGEAPTLRDVGAWSLSHVDLVVLSACETGLGGFDNNGEQILGLGYQFQRRGAKAVIASLWAVSDQGTQVLMTAFYEALALGMSKTEALQAAQRALITNDFAAVGGRREAMLEWVSSVTGQPLPPRGTLAHPYYWAPFILIGNGL